MSLVDQVTFIGVDLVWQSNKNHTGITVLRGSASGAELSHYSEGVALLSDVVNYVDAHATADTVVAIDAPLIVNNISGQRACEKLVSRKFGRQHASAHSFNLSLYPDPGGVRFAGELKRLGFQHTVAAPGRLRSGRWLFEVYPHPAQVILFSRNSIIRYKKGTVSQKRQGLETLRSYLRQHLIEAEPLLILNPRLEDLLSVTLSSYSGKPLKRYEDVLDAVFCAYLALYYWYWGSERNEVLGDLLEGYIVNPTHPI